MTLGLEETADGDGVGPRDSAEDGDRLRVWVRDADFVGDGEWESLRDGVRVRGGVPDAVREVDRLTDAVSGWDLEPDADDETDAEGLCEGVAASLSDWLGVRDCDDVGERVRVRLAACERVRVPVRVADGESLMRCEGEADDDGDSLGVAHCDGVAVGVSSDVTVCVGVCDGVAATLPVDDGVRVREAVCVVDRVRDAVTDWLGLALCEADALCVADCDGVALRVSPVVRVRVAVRSCVPERDGMTVGACVELLSSTGGDADWLGLWELLPDVDALDDGEPEPLGVRDTLRV